MRQTIRRAARRGAILAALALCALSGAASAQDMQRIQTREYDRKINQTRDAYDARDWDRAFRLASETARWGDKWSQFALGSMYLEGQGGAEENVLLAYAWIKASAEGGTEEFVAAADRLRAAIPEQYHAQADDAAAQVIAKYGMEATGVTCNLRRQLNSNRKIFDCRKPHSMNDEWIEVPRYDLADAR